MDRPAFDAPAPSTAGVPNARNDRLARYLELIAEPQASRTLDEIFTRLAEGESLTELCRGWDVGYSKVMQWLMADLNRYDVYKRALEAQAHGHIERATEIADEEPAMCEGRYGQSIDAAGIARAKLRIETRFKVAKFHAPERYGETSAGGGGGVTVIINRGVGPEPAVAIEGKTLTVGA